MTSNASPTTESTPAESTAPESTTATSVSPQSGAATDPDEMTCRAYLSLTPEQQQATVKTYAQRHDKPLVSSNENAYLLVAAFCQADPDQLLKNNLMLQ